MMRVAPYSVKVELGSNRLGLFLFFNRGMLALGECFLGSFTRGEGGRTVLGDGLREDCFDIALVSTYRKECASVNSDRCRTIRAFNGCSWLRLEQRVEPTPGESLRR